MDGINHKIDKRGVEYKRAKKKKKKETEADFPKSFFKSF